MAIFMCERNFGSAMTEDAFFEGGKVLAPCLQARDITWVSSHLSTDGMRSVCVFDAPNAEVVREANRTAGLPFEKVWPAKIYRP